ncbi:glycoside hydrolase family 127 protein [Acrodontium crateriforme]|uniref:Glycoside hydrolase family 127 protein n=1 Tax=Acrodontium crateriforme TaxID=150365 RepID=A0AAQ3R748_9PEZI|nr:glycoside hydrolase family 127 protein [Acrodontium crateriforme]
MSYPQTSFWRTTVAPNSLIGKRRNTVSSVTLLYQLDVLKKTGRYDAFKLKWNAVYDEPPMVWPIPNHLFWDSDVAKWIEGACYFLQQRSNKEIDAAVQELVAMIHDAQQPDGYINIHFTVVEPGKRFTNLRDFHELYNAGHLIEAAISHEQYYKNGTFLHPILKYVDLLCTTFGPNPNQIHGYPGHPEIEMALLRLYTLTENPKYLNLGRYFITERGNPRGQDGRHFFDVESEKRGDDPNKRPAFYPESRCLWYHQAQAPLAEQQTIEGHSVRGTYLLSSVADLLRIDGNASEPKLTEAVYRLWDNMVNCKMYITGGIGAIKQWEGFGPNYFLPQGTDEGGCYSETCAAIGVMMFAERMLQLDLDAKFADVMELCFYNAVLTAMSHDGRRFTYENQLASSEKNLSQREEWFTVACCPPNVLRLLGQIGGYIWTYQTQSTDEHATISVHLYISSKVQLEVGGGIIELEQESNWPMEGEIKFVLRRQSTTEIDIKLRIPAWAKVYNLSPECGEATTHKGYLKIPSAWLRNNNTFTISIPLEARLVTPHPFTNQNVIAIARGPVIYCAEDVDNTWVKDHFKVFNMEQKHQ